MDVLVVAFTGDDSPGLVHALAEVVSDHGGNWEASQMTSVGGVFAGNLVVSAEAERVEPLMEDLRALNGMLEVTVHRAHAPVSDVGSARSLHVQMDGGDHPGIMEEFAAAVARPRVNVRRLDSRNVDSHPDPRRDVPGRAADGATVRHCRMVADLDLDDDVDVSALREELLALARGLGVEIRFDPAL